MFRKLLTEFIGTFFLAYTVSLVATQGGNPVAVIAIPFALMVMVYMGGSVSGGHFNPAVSTAALLAKKMPAKDYVPYVLAQIVGAIFAAYVSYLVLDQTFPFGPGAGVRATQALIVEIVFTFALALVVLNSACTKRTEGNSFYGFAIGGTVLVGAFAGGGVSGGAFNPAVGIGPTVVHAVLGGGDFNSVWLYIVGPLVGAGIAALVFKVQEGHEPEAGT